MSAGAVFVDGANWYNHLREIGLHPPGIDIEKVSLKLTRGRQLVRIEYFIPLIDSSGGKAYKANQQLLSDLAKKRLVTVNLGYIDRHLETNECARELLAYLSGLRERLPGPVYRFLVELGRRHARRVVFREKGIDVALACKMVEMAMNNVYDVAYLLSGDGDYRPAVHMVRGMGKRVFAADPAIGERRRAACDVAVRLRSEWFSDSYL